MQIPRSARKLALFFLTVASLAAASESQPGPLPKLSIHPSGNSQILLEWPASATGYTVEESSTVGPAASWKPVNLSPTRVGDRFQARMALHLSPRFFRLAAPAEPPPGSVAFFLPDEPPTRGFDAVYDAAGRLHFVYVRHSLVREVQDVVYGACEPNLDCDQAQNWRTLTVHSGAIGTVQIKVTPDGRPRLVLEDQYTVAGARLAYMACEANCLSHAGWNGIALLSNFQLGQAFALHAHQRWFALDPQGGPRILASGVDGTQFLACNHDCTQPTGDWTSTPIDTTGDPFQSTHLLAPVLRIDARGRPHILGQNSRALVYLTTQGDFRLPETWQRTFLTDAFRPGPPDTLPVPMYFAGELDIEIDTQGTVVAAFGGLDANTEQPNAYLFRCPADCDHTASWTGRSFPGTPVGSLDLALDRNQNPYFLFAGQRADTGERVLQLATCDTADCYRPGARWTAEVVSRSTTLESERPVQRYPETPSLCSIPTTSWEFASSRLIFHPSGSMRLAINAAASSICAPGMSEWIDRWGTTRRGRTVDVWVIEARARWATLR